MRNKRLYISCAIFTCAMVFGIFHLNAGSPPQPPSPSAFSIPGNLGGDQAMPGLDSDPQSAVPSGVPDWSTSLVGDTSGTEWEEFKLEWNLPGEPLSEDLVGFYVERRDGPGAWRIIQFAGATTDDYTDKVKFANQRYHYRVTPVYDINGTNIRGIPSNIERFFPQATLELWVRARENVNHDDPEICGYPPFYDENSEDPMDCEEARRRFRTRTERTFYVKNRWNESHWGDPVGLGYTFKRNHTYNKEIVERALPKELGCVHEVKKTESHDYFREYRHYDTDTGNLTKRQTRISDIERVDDESWEGVSFWEEVNYELGTEERNDDLLVPNRSTVGTLIENKESTTSTRWESRKVYYHENQDPDPENPSHGWWIITEVVTRTLSDEIGVDDDEDEDEPLMEEWGEWNVVGQDGAYRHIVVPEAECEPAHPKIKEIEYYWTFDKPVAAGEARWAVHYFPDLDEDGEPVADPNFDYKEWTASRNSQRSRTYSILIEDMPDLGTYNIRRINGGIVSQDWRGTADDLERQTGNFNDNRIVAGDAIDPSGVSIQVDAENNSTLAVMDIGVSGWLPSVVDSEWTTTLNWQTQWIEVWDGNPGAPGSTELTPPVVFEGTVGETLQIHPREIDSENDPKVITEVITMSVVDGDQKAVFNDNGKFHIVQWPPEDTDDPAFSLRIPVSDATGPRYRKIGLSGRPLADSKPQAEEETDQEKEETYIDAFNLGLRHSVTDIYVPVEGSELVLSARRNFQGEIWDFQSGLRPHERLDRPFGAGWTSNLVGVIHFIDPEGPNMDGFAEPNEAFVYDEDGSIHHFVEYEKDNSTVWVPFARGRHEGRAFLTSLTEEAGEWVFRKKHGNTLYFEKGGPIDKGPFERGTVSRDRLEGKSTDVVTHTFSRLFRVEDRLGYQLRYSYEEGANGPTTLIPYKIRAVDPFGTDIPGLQIYIRQTDQKRITDIWDPRGNKISYVYENSPEMSFHPVTGASQPLEFLVRAEFEDGSETVYGYNRENVVDVEPETVPKAIGRAPNPKFHVNVTEIADALGNTWKFEYEFDHSHEIWISSNIAHGYFPQGGQPRNVVRVSLPDETLKDVHLENHSLVRVEIDGSGQESFDGQRETAVLDANGKRTLYEFLDNHVITLTAFHEFYFPNDPEMNLENPRLVYFERMDVTHGEFGVETFTFNPEAGFALASVTDLSGNQTEFFYDDVFTPPQWLQDVYPPSFDGFGLYDDVTSQKNALGNERTFSYGVHRIMETMTDEEGRFTEWEVDAMGRRLRREVSEYDGGPLVGETVWEYGDSRWLGFVTERKVRALPGAGDPSWVADLITEFDPDPSGRVAVRREFPVVDADDPDGSGTPLPALETTYTYDFNNNRTSVSDAKGKIEVFLYDERNRLIEKTFHNWEFEDFQFDLRGNRTGERTGHYVGSEPNYTSPKSVLREKEHRYDEFGRRIETEVVMSDGPNLVTKRAFNPVGWVIEEVDARQGRTSHSYDALGRRAETRDPEDNITRFFYDGPNSGASAFDIDGFQPTRIVDARGFAREFDYDALYRLKEERSEIRSGEFAATTYEYDDVGNTVRVTDPLGTVTFTEYDALDRPFRVTSAEGTPVEVSTETGYTSTGLEWRYEDGEGHVTRTVYDRAGRPIQTIFPLTDAGEAIERNFYDPAGNLERFVNAENVEREYVYDDRHRLIEEWLPDIFDAVSEQTVTDAKIIWTYNEAGEVLSETDAKGNTTEYVYDDAGRMTKTVFPPGFGEIVTEYDANGNPIEVTDQENKVTVNDYDALDRLRFTTQTYMEDSSPVELRVEFVYDANGNQIFVLDGRKQRTEFVYDGLDRLVEEIDVKGGRTRYVYNALNKTHRIDANGRVVRYEYDELHRTAEVHYSGSPTEERHYTYDDNHNIVSVTHPNQDGLTDVVYEYNERDQVIEETSAGFTHVYEYDRVGNRTKVIYGPPSGLSVTYDYDDLDRLEKVIEEDGSGVRESVYQYDLNSNSHRLIFNNNEVIVSIHDAVNRLDERTALGPDGTSVLYEYDLTWDKAGNLTGIEEKFHAGQLPDRTVTNVYDGVNRLIEETVVIAAETVQTQYRYDRGNNRTRKTVLTTPDGEPEPTGEAITYYTHNRLNQLTAYTELFEGQGKRVRFDYDANGNRIRRTEGEVVRGYFYDGENRLTRVVVDGEERFVDVRPENHPGQTLRARYFVDGVVHSYRYDYRTRRVERDEPGTAKTAVTFAGGVSLFELEEGAANPEVEYVRGADIGGGVGGILYSLRSAGIAYSHYNHRGDVVARTDASGSLTYEAHYEAFGTRTEEQGTNPDRHRANTKEEDPTGLLNEGFRYRCLETGVFLTRDPAGFVDGPNLYAYVVQNPWTYFDPEGLFRDTEFGVRFGIGLGFDTGGGLVPRFDITLSAQNEVSESARFTVDVNYSRYRNAPGTANNGRQTGRDFSIFGNLTFDGSGSGDPIPMQTLNRNTMSAFPNEFGSSLSWGGGINFNKFTNDMTTHHVFGGRNGDTLISYQNDMGTLPGVPFIGQGTDQAWTASLDVARSTGSGSNDYFKAGWQGFTGIRGELNRTTNMHRQPVGQEFGNRSEFYFDFPMGNSFRGTGAYSGPRTDWPQRRVHDLPWNSDAGYFPRTAAPRGVIQNRWEGSFR